jgi:HK97 family phage major capsid protein
MEALARAFNKAGVFAEKRDSMTVADLQSGGLLSPTQRKPFLKGIYDSTPIFGKVTREMMMAPTHEISRIAMGGRILKKPPAENTAVDSSKRVKPSTGKTTLAANQFVGEVDLSERLILQNIDREGFVDEVLLEVANQCGVDIAVTLMQGDTSLQTGITDDQDALSVLDGWLVQADASGHTFDAAGAALDSDLLSSVFAAMPAKHVQSTNAKLEFMMTYLLGLNWRQAWERRATTGGDAVQADGVNAPRKWGRPVTESTEIPTDTYNNATVGTVLFTDPKNLVAGIAENIKIRVFPYPPERVIKILVEMEIDAGFLRPDQVVIARNVAIAS